jgi:hypothetical protein
MVPNTNGLLLSAWQNAVAVYKAKTKNIPAVFIT